MSTALRGARDGDRTMANGIKLDDLLRLIGVMAVAVATAWVVQVVEFDGSSALGKLAWMVAAAVIAGGGTGLIFTSLGVRAADETSHA